MKDRKERVWVQQEDGTYFEIRRRGEVSVQRFDHFVTKLPEGARVVPAPPMINHSPEDLIKLKAMRDQYAATFQDVQTPARTMVFNILDHPTLSFKEKGKKLLALRKQFKMDDISNVQKQKLIGRNANSDAVDKQGRVPLATTTSLPLRPEEPAPLKEHEEELLRIGRSWVQGLLNGAQKMQLQANECSRLHKLIEQVKMVVAEPIHTFVVKHDWLAAFGSSLEGDDGPIMLPFPISAFEFKISGRLIIIISLSLPAGPLATRR